MAVSGGAATKKLLPSAKFGPHSLLMLRGNAENRTSHLYRVVLRGPVQTGTTAGAPEAPGDEATGEGRRHRRRWLSAGRRRGSGDDGPAPLLGPSHRGSVPDPPHRDPRAPHNVIPINSTKYSASFLALFSLCSTLPILFSTIRFVRLPTQ